MPVVLTLVGRVRDWQALRRLHQEELIQQAREAGATRFGLYRDVRDASQALVVGVFPDHEAAREMERALGGQLDSLLSGAPAEDRVWEAIGTDSIGDGLP